jgi:membrane associated rhomboid family serine protease
MIPIRDTIPSKNYPVVNNVIIGINVLVFIVELSKGEGLNQFIFTYGLVPARYSVPDIAAFFSFGQQAISFVSFMFLHGGFWHLLGNMWSLYIFGDNIEDRLGHVRYLVFYLLCGLVSGLLHFLINWESRVPTIGASGAIAGVMGAYLISYPRSKILTLIPILFIPYFIEIPASFFLSIWFLFQFLNAAVTPAQAGGIAWWAHIGGFLAGLVLLKLFLTLPEGRMSYSMRGVTSKQKTPHLQVVNVLGSNEDPHLYGKIIVSPREARLGATKLINIPWGFHSRLFRINIPSGTVHGTTLRLKGMGKQALNGQKGDMYLRVFIQDRETSRRIWGPDKV